MDVDVDMEERSLRDRQARGGSEKREEGRKVEDVRERGSREGSLGEFQGGLRRVLFFSSLSCHGAYVGMLEKVVRVKRGRCSRNAGIGDR